MKYKDNIKDVANLKPDYLGFIFYPKSKRFIGLDFDKSHLQEIDKSIEKVAVFVNAHHHEIVEFSRLYDIQTLQLHGDESADFCKALKDEGFNIIKAFGVDAKFNFNSLNNYADAVDYFLFDTKTLDYGGSGKVFDWEVLNNYTLAKPFFLSGGLSLSNLKEIENLKHPQLYVVDLNSKFEVEPGLKNKEMLNEAFTIIRGIRNGK